MIRKKKKIISFIFIFTAIFLCIGCISASALSDDKIVDILSKNPEIFEQNNLFTGTLRTVGWTITWVLVYISKTAAYVYDTCFGFLDFTSYGPIQNFIEQWKPVFVALVCLSLLLIGVLMCVGWEKKPKFMINLLIAVTVVTSSTFCINTLNSFISSSVRNDILGSTSSTNVVFKMIGTNLHDILYLDSVVGLENINEGNNAKKTNKNLTETQFNNINFGEVVNPDDLDGDAKEILGKQLVTESITGDGATYGLKDVYDGVAWTDILNNYYYRYKIDFLVVWIELLALILVYLFLSYTVIRSIYEIVVHQFVAYLYAANLNSNQKILKIFDSLKDLYIVLILTTVTLKLYLIATSYINDWGINGLTKAFILLFLAFAVVDGPNIVQKLTGVDMGANNALRKFASLMYGARAVSGVAKSVAGVTKSAFKGGKNIADKLTEAGSSSFGGNTPPDSGTDSNNSNNSLNQQNNQSNLNHADNKADNNDNATINQDNSQNSNDSINENGNISEAAATSDSNLNDSNNAAISSEQGKQNGGYQMNDIGQVPNKKDALNGVNGKTGNANQNSMKQMEKDLSKNNKAPSINHAQGNTKPNTPIDSKGNILNTNRLSNSNNSSPIGTNNKSSFTAASETSTGNREANHTTPSRVNSSRTNPIKENLDNKTKKGEMK